VGVYDGKTRGKKKKKSITTHKMRQGKGKGVPSHEKKKRGGSHDEEEIRKMCHAKAPNQPKRKVLHQGKESIIGSQEAFGKNTLSKNKGGGGGKK